MFSQNAADFRKFIYACWCKRHEAELSDLERQVLTILNAHPEYDTTVFEQWEEALKTSYPADAHRNPFLHLSLHFGLQDQLSTNRPSGITELYRQTLSRYPQDEHRIQHQMIDVLYAIMQDQLQHPETPLDDADYLAILKKYLHYS